MRFLAALFCLAIFPATFAAQPFSGLSPEEAVKAFTLPEGFHAALVTAEPDVVQPVAFEFDDRGRIWVAEFLSYPKWAPEGHDRIVLLGDSTGSGRMNTRTVVWDKANYLTSFTLGFGGIWATSPPNLYFIPCDFNADKPVIGDPQIVLDGWSHAGTHNIVNNLTWGPDGWLYGCNGISSRSRVGPPGTPEASRTFIDGGIWRYHPVTKKLEQICTGMTNPWGMDWDERGELFCTNNVTAHLFHVIPGARFERSHEQDQNPYTYELMGGIADHKHYAGEWQDTKKGLKQADLGGGHSHAGALIYKNKDWPAQYLNTIFMCNTHGNRINTDKLELTPNGYVAHHGEDFVSNDKSFRGVSLKMGPDGAMYVTDWHQDGECHSGTEVGSGRIYKIWYGEKMPSSIDAVTSLTKRETLKSLLTDSNTWVAKHALRIWAEIKRSENPLQLSERINDSPEDSGIDRNAFDAKLIAIRDEISKSPRQFESLRRIQLSKLPEPFSSRLYFILAKNSTEAENRNYRLFLWYAIEPLLENDPSWAFLVFRNTKIPALRPFIARRLSEHQLPLVVEELAKTTDEALQLDLLKGMSAALKGRYKFPEPPAWKLWYSAQKPETVNQPETRNQKPETIFALAQQIAAVFGDAVSLDHLRAVAEDKKAGLAPRQNALQSLLDARYEKIVPLLQKLVRDLDMRRDAIRALGRFDDPQTPLLILQLYPNFDAAEKADALATLAARPAGAQALLGALKNKSVPKSDLNAQTVNALQAHGLAEIDTWVHENWGLARTTAADTLAEIARLKKVVANAPPKSADATRGKDVFTKTCSGCHTLFGSGGKVGPDLTGSGRGNLDYLLVNIVDPNAIVPQEYLAWLVKTTDGRILNGLIRNEREEGFDVVTATETISLRTEEIKSKKRGTLSMMPEGILNALKENEFLDLIAYLQSNTTH